MELYQNILADMLAKYTMKISFENLNCCSPHDMVEMTCYNALKKIKAVIGDDSLSDFECIEEIVVIFESIGSGGGSRHDFG